MVAKVFVRSEYNYDMAAASDASGLRCEDESLCKQSFAEEADINTIVRRFNLTGQLPQGIKAPSYDDFDAVYDYQSAMNVLRAAEESFNAMPAAVRARFANDPAQFVSFCDDPANREEAKKMGLVFDRELPKPVEVRIVDDAVKEAASHGERSEWLDEGRRVDDRAGVDVGDRADGKAVRQERPSAGAVKGSRGGDSGRKGR